MTGAGRTSPADDAAQPDAAQPDAAAAVPATGVRAGWRFVLPLTVAIAVAAADQGTKLWALSRLAADRVIAVPGGLIDLQLTTNPGAALSVGSGSTWLFTVVAAATVAILPWFAARAQSRVQAIALGLLLGGAAGNLLDRLFRAPAPGRGRVVDFIDYHGLFIGNVADIAIVVGAAILVLRAMLPLSREHRVQVTQSGDAAQS